MVLFGDIGSVFVMGLVGIFFIVLIVTASKLLSPKRPNPIKNAPFECGQVPVGAGKMHFMMQYYAYFLMFIVFDVLSMFLYAWAVAYRPGPGWAGLGVSSDWMVTLFIGVLFVPMGFALYLAGKRELW
ncbi:MAG: NADH-quinone oxidoreductase subunit A [Nitrososphaerales archaeon]|jgi:NADH-quinone oxidoreductase subunit A